MIELRFHIQHPPVPVSPGRLDVVLYDGVAPRGFPRVGSGVREGLRRLGRPVGVRSFDLLTIALAVTAADTFVNRQRRSDVGWGRELRLAVPLADPTPWSKVMPVLTEALGFLTGDSWSVDLGGGGRTPPAPVAGRGRILDLAGADSVCLFSGGLDSTIGVLDLLADRKRPLLVSHAYQGDNGRQRSIQEHAFRNLPRLALLANPYWPSSGGFDITMRGRSFGFLAMAAAAAGTLVPPAGSRVRLLVPENGFIAINAPLTRRRLGSLSTRTTHPHFLGLVQRLFDGLGIPAVIENPYVLATKGEMLRRCRLQATLHGLADGTVSCGHWKRHGVQCGRCVPCLVRRASFHAAGTPDPTPYACGDISSPLKPEHRGDLLALGRAASWSPAERARAVGASGPLPADPASRGGYEDVVARGLAEVRSYLAACNVRV